MKKLNLYYIIADKVQTDLFEKKIIRLRQQFDRGKSPVVTALEHHYLVLSYHFNLKNFFSKPLNQNIPKESIIYHLPAGRDSKGESVTKLLEKLKGSIPIVMRSYDAHSPIKTHKDYMLRYHDMCVTYLRKWVNDEDILFGQLCFDSYMHFKIDKNVNRRKLACMILRNRKNSEYHVDDKAFRKKGLELRKKYKLRKEIVKKQQISIYGSGWSSKMKNYKGPIYPFDQKYFTLAKYKFNIIIENAEVDNYISEKIHDSLMALTVPIYFGSPVVNEFIPKTCFINGSNFKNLDHLLEHISSMTQKQYDKIVENMLNHRLEIFKSFNTQVNFSEVVYNWYNRKYDVKYGPNQNEYADVESKISSVTIKKSNSIKSNLLREYKRLTSK